ncbi:MAG: AzlC family ABC transporter permease [Deltaproteobacteria bacterium]|nr:AzlC family ABC transporter permease [Deltaproteobacteria bacterium]
MAFSVHFRDGVKTAIPVWFAFIPIAFAMGVAAKAHGLHWGEIVLMSALVYGGPSQFAALEPLGAGKPAVQILLATFLINIRFLPMSATLAPYFRWAKGMRLFLAAHLVSPSSFILTHLHAQRQKGSPGSPAKSETLDERGKYLDYFFGVSTTCFLVWVTGTAFGYWAALAVPPAFNEGLRFVLPGYFACIFALEIREWFLRLVCLISLMVAVPTAVFSPEWGWLVTSLVVATCIWGVERWMERVS